jgi:hypothetical protein
LIQPPKPKLAKFCVNNSRLSPLQARNCSPRPARFSRRSRKLPRPLLRPLQPLQPLLQQARMFNTRRNLKIVRASHCSPAPRPSKPPPPRPLHKQRRQHLRRLIRSPRRCKPIPNLIESTPARLIPWARSSLAKARKRSSAASRIACAL